MANNEKADNGKSADESKLAEELVQEKVKSDDTTLEERDPVSPVSSDTHPSVAEEDEELYAQTLRDAESDEDFDEDDLDEEDETAPFNEEGSTGKLMLEILPDRARRAELKLRDRLKGSVGVWLRDTQESFLFDWSQDEPRCSRDSLDSCTCKITMGEKELDRISKGVLNPQIALLSHRVIVEGNHSMAIYFFNLIVRPPRNGDRSY
jgi:hypothetical protein